MLWRHKRVLGERRLLEEVHLSKDLRKRQVWRRGHPREGSRISQGTESLACWPGIGLASDEAPKSMLKELASFYWLWESLKFKVGEGQNNNLRGNLVHRKSLGLETRCCHV
jgi:hypothetical protein